MLIDLLIIILAISSIYRSWGSGFIRQLLLTAGFFGGLFLGRFLETYTIHFVHTQFSRSLMTLITVLGTALIGLGIGESIGISLKYRLLDKKLNKLDNLLGAVLSVGSVLISIWLLSAVAHSLPNNNLSVELSKSKIVTALDNTLPSAPNVIADLGKLIDPNGFPDVFIGSEPIPRGNVNLPSLGDLSSVVNADKDSVVRVQGQGCGGIVSGSGFVVSSDTIVTNAHVVAGIASPVVEDANGNHNAVVISFDPNLDLAILRVNNVAGKPLTIDPKDAGSGTPAAVLGYPGGGPFNAGPAAVLDEFQATGHDIYGNGATVRSVYEIHATVIPGNSGGPLINEQGQVIGVVFAESTTYNNVGYALSMSKVLGEIQQAQNDQQQVSTGACAE